MSSNDQPIPPEWEPTASAPESCRTVLIVDDEPVIGQVLAVHLRSRGFETTEVASAAAALGAGKKYSLGVFDIELGDGNGLDVAEELLERGLVRDAIFYSGVVDTGIRDRANAIGTFVSKSIGIQAVVRTVEARAGSHSSGLRPSFVASRASNNR